MIDRRINFFQKNCNDCAIFQRLVAKINQKTLHHILFKDFSLSKKKN